MSVREKIHWVAFVSLIVGFGWYFLRYPWGIADTEAGMWASVWMMIPVTVIFLIPMTLATAVLTIRAPKEAYLAEDERERTIHLKGTHAAYYPLVLGVWVNIALMFGGAQFGWSLNILMATLVLSELVRIGAQLYYYRRGY